MSVGSGKADQLRVLGPCLRFFLIGHGVDARGQVRTSYEEGALGRFHRYGHRVVAGGGP